MWCRFVQNRVKEIRENISNTLWRFCPGTDNPAIPIPSRGLDYTKSEKREKWLHGLEFLNSPYTLWPTIPDLAVRDVNDLHINEVSVNRR